ncbi:alpha/beta hydrolase [uncultured Shewanella sp.]|uniref:alpha/beta fold hydrolase n=1 Tax=uncultured Shewanella sp. TaxID=173975 RepID=UPI00263190E2|nr:alpha/beta hydrolase [uncultured Shewanella sp.]
MMRVINLAIIIASMIFLVGRVMAEEVIINKNLTIHYEQAGSGDTTIIFIPGWMMSSQVFEHQLAHFKGSKQYRALAYDPRGQGLSSKWVEGQTYQQHARDLAQLIQKLALKKVILVGWSYGVTEQLAYINQFGIDKVKAMIMIDTGPKIAGNSRDEWVWYLKDDADGYSRSFTEGIIEHRAQVIAEFSRWMLEEPTSDSVAWVSSIAEQTPSSVAALTNGTGFYLDYSEDLKALEGKIPLLYVVRDEMKGVASQWIQANTPSATAVYMGKHMMFWERANAFNHAMDTFLSSIDGNIF